MQDYTDGTEGYDHDAIYNVYDKDVADKNLYGSYTIKTDSVTKAQMGEVTDTNRNVNTTLVAPYTGKGWFYKFQSDQLQSEKSLVHHLS